MVRFFTPTAEAPANPQAVSVVGHARHASSWTSDRRNPGTTVTIGTPIEDEPQPGNDQRTTSRS